MMHSSSQILYDYTNNVCSMKDFAYCFTDLAKVFKCYDPNTKVRNNTEALNRSTYNKNDALQKGNKLENFIKSEQPHSETKSIISSKLGCIEECVKSTAKVNSTVENEISSNKHQSIGTNSNSGKGENKRVYTSNPKSSNRKISPTIIKPNVVNVVEKRKLKRLSGTQEGSKRSPRDGVGSKIKQFEHRLFQNLNDEENRQKRRIEKLKVMYVEEKRNSISMQEEIHNSTFDYKQKNSDKGNYDRSSAESGSSKAQYRKVNTEIPEIQIKVGVQNNHYNFFNTINESDEDDENVVTVIGLNNRNYKFKKTQSRDFNIISPTSKESSVILPSMHGWSQNQYKTRREFYLKHRIEPPIDLRNSNGRYKMMNQNKIRSKTGSKDRDIQ